MLKSKGTIRSLLNKIMWDPQLKNRNYLITFIHRGIPGNEKTIESRIIKGISSNFISYIDKDDFIYIPFHRILSIRDTETKEILYLKK